jgi:putative redox protein
MVTTSAVYDGNKACTLTHSESGTSIRSDAPRDIGGSASAFSPTDLVGAALAGCILTTMAMFAERHEVDITGATATVTKEMTTDAPRRIARLAATVTLPAARVPVAFRERLEKAGHACPVNKSLHPDIEAPVTYAYV